MEKLRIAPATIPSYSMTLPVSGMIVKYRPFIVREEKVLLIALQTNDPNQIIEAIRNIILSCTHNQIDTKKIPAADANYAMLQIRARSVGEEVRPVVKCSKCEGKTPIKINLEKIQVTRTKKEEISPNIEINKETTLIMRFPTIHDLDVTKDPTSMVFDMVYSCIDKVMYEDKVYDRGDVNEEDVALFVDSLLPEHFKKISQFLESAPTVIYEFSFNCPNCKSKVKVALENISDFFL